jgi:hypothetical protein
MRRFTGYESRRALARAAGSIAFGSLALLALSVAAPAQAADLYYGRGAPRLYEAPPQPRYGEYYEYRAPAPPAVPVEAPLEYRVVVYPPRRLYGEIHSYPPPAYPPRVRYGDRYHEPRVRYDERYEERYQEFPADDRAAELRRYPPRRVYREARVHDPYDELPYEPYARAAEPEPLLPPGYVGRPRW